MSAPYVCCRSAIWPGLDWVVNGGGGSASGVDARCVDRTRRASTPAPLAAAAVAANSVRIFIVSRR
jgi:hypothetical protein